MKNSLNIRSIIVFIAVIIAGYLAMRPIAGQPNNFSYSAAIILITLVFWSLSVIPPFLTGLIFFALVAVFNLIEPNVLFSGFSSSAVWLIISGFIIGEAISTTGIGKRLALIIAPYLTTSYVKLISGLVVTAMLLGFVMPSSVGRSVVLIPIGMALAEQLGFAKGSSGRIGIAVTLALACNMPSFAILPSNIPNMILTGASENLFGISFGYLEYLALHFPILGIVKSAVLVLVVVKIFPAQIDINDKTSSQARNDHFDLKKQNKVLFILTMTLLFWITDSIHGVNPAWVGIVTAIFLLLPKYGVVEPKAFNRSVDFGTVIFVAAALGLGALVNLSGIGTSVGQIFSSALSNSHDSTFYNFMSLCSISTLTGLITTIPGVPTVLSPMAADFAHSTGFSLEAVLMTQVIGFSTVIFPYQVAPLIVAMQLSQEKLSSLIKVSLPLAVITLLILMPLDYLWWNLLGWI
ncbi:SLC13 family permease [Vibrio sp. RC27]